MVYRMQAIKKETSGRFEDALLATVQCICYPARFFAKVRTQLIGTKWSLCTFLCMQPLQVMCQAVFVSTGSIGHFLTNYVSHQELYKSMKGLGTDDEALIRVVTTRAEVDMYYIKQEFATMYQKTLEHMIAGDTSGNYRYFLVTLVGGA